MDSICQFWPLWKGWSRSSITTSIFTKCLGIRISFFYHLKKVERILKGSLDLIPLPSPSAKIQIMDREVCLTNKGKTLLVIFWKQKVCWHYPAMFCRITSSKLPSKNLNFNWRWRWWDQIQAIFLNLFYFKGNVSNFLIKLGIISTPTDFIQILFIFL